MSDHGEIQKRRTSFISQDIQLLWRLVQEHIDLLENKTGRGSHEKRHEVSSRRETFPGSRFTFWCRLIPQPVQLQAWESIVREYNRKQVGGIKTSTQLRDKYKNEKKLKKNQLLENGIETNPFSVKFMDIKVDENEEFQDVLIDESDYTQTPDRVESPEPEQEPPSKRLRISSIQDEINESRAEGLRLDNKYKQLMIEKIQLEKKFLMEKSLLEKIKLELEIQKLREA
jgi:hypothetical protein